ncbi:MAG: CRTAC1 family protein [Planctomycetota bacterium]
MLLPSSRHWLFRSVLNFLVWSAICSFAKSQETEIRLVDATEESGINFVHSHGGSTEGYIVEGMSTGVVTLDYDGDGYQDIYFLNGAALRGTKMEKEPTNALYRNNGDGTFSDVTDEAGVGDTGYGLGASVADYDGDGDPDIYVNNFGPNVLFRNNGDKSFTNVTKDAGVGNGNQVGAGVGFLDIDKDGDLDLYVANYVNFTYDNHVPIVIKGKRFQAGPQYYEPVPDTLYRNEGDGTFTDISEESGIAAVSGPGMGLVCADLDNDQDTDIYVCNDGQPNFLFLNDGKGVFEEVGLLYGAACDSSGKANSSMGVDCADFNRDGLLDLIVTNYQAEMPVLYRNLGDGLFEDATSNARVTRELFPHVNWGTGFVDFDNDGDKDIYIACGHFDRIEDIDDRTAMKIRNYVLQNEDGRYTDVSRVAGNGLEIVETSRAAAFEDFDNDGDIDVIVVNSNSAVSYLRNELANENHWIQVSLKQEGGNPRAIGARVEVTVNGSTQLSEVMSGKGYQSQFGAILHFGLGKYDEKEIVVRVLWPDGTEQQSKVPVDKTSELVHD